MARQRKGQRQSVPQKSRLLIVTEDEKAAPLYFREIVFDQGIIPRRVVIDGSCGSDPDSVVKRLIETWEDEARGLRAGETPFDRAFAVVDRDGHKSFNRAQNRLVQKDAFLRDQLREAAKVVGPDTDHGRALLARAAEPLLVFSVSEPCFEYWILLHVSDAQAPYVRTGKKKKGFKSTCDHAASDLKQALKEQGQPEYRKGASGLWHRTKDAYAIAKQRAERGRARAERRETANPSTSLDMVVDAILTLDR